MPVSFWVSSVSNPRWCTRVAIFFQIYKSFLHSIFSSSYHIALLMVVASSADECMTPMPWICSSFKKPVRDWFVWQKPSHSLIMIPKVFSWHFQRYPGHDKLQIQIFYGFERPPAGDRILEVLQFTRQCVSLSLSLSLSLCLSVCGS